MASRTVHAEIPWIWARLTLFLVLEGILLILYALKIQRETLVFGATVIGAAFTLYTFLRGIEDRRVQEAARLIERWNSSDRAEMRRTMNEITEGRLDLETLGRTEKGGKISNDLKEKREHLVSALNLYEELAISIFEGGLDEDRAYRFFSVVIRQTYDSVMPWIENERRIDKATRYFSDFQKLAEKWREK